MQDENLQYIIDKYPWLTHHSNESTSNSSATSVQSPLIYDDHSPCLLAQKKLNASGKKNFDPGTLMGQNITKLIPMQKLLEIDGFRFVATVQDINAIDRYCYTDPQNAKLANDAAKKKKKNHNAQQGSKIHSKDLMYSGNPDKQQISELIKNIRHLREKLRTLLGKKNSKRIYEAVQRGDESRYSGYGGQLGEVIVELVKLHATFLQIPMKNWSTSHVTELVKTLGWGTRWTGYAELMKKESIDGVKLPNLTIDDLVNIGFAKKDAHTVVEFAKQRRTKHPPPINELAALLRSLNLENYIPAFTLFGFDDPYELYNMEKHEFETMASQVNLKPNHKLKLQRWRENFDYNPESFREWKHQMPRTSLSTLLLELHLDEHIPVLVPIFAAYGVYKPEQLRNLNKNILDMVAKTANMSSDHKAGLQRWCQNSYEQVSKTALKFNQRLKRRRHQNHDKDHVKPPNKSITTKEIIQTKHEEVSLFQPESQQLKIEVTGGERIVKKLLKLSKEQSEKNGFMCTALDCAENLCGYCVAVTESLMDSDENSAITKLPNDNKQQKDKVCIPANENIVKKKQPGRKVYQLDLTRFSSLPLFLQNPRLYFPIYQTNQFLYSLSLDENEVRNNRTYAIAEFLSAGMPLKSLDIRGNSAILDFAAETLILSFMVNKTLKSFCGIDLRAILENAPSSILLDFCGTTSLTVNPQLFETSLKMETCNADKATQKEVLIIDQRRKIICDYDREVIATTWCSECLMYFCAHCNSLLHNTRAKKVHKRKLLTQFHTEDNS